MALAINTLGKSDVQVTEMGFCGASLGAVGSRVSRTGDVGCGHYRP